VSEVVTTGLQVAPLLVDLEYRVDVHTLDTLLLDGIPHDVGVLAQELPADHVPRFSRPWQNRIAPYRRTATRRTRADPPERKYR